MGRRIVLLTLLTLTTLLLGSALLVHRTFRAASRSATNLIEERLSAIGITAAVSLPGHEHKSRVLAELVIYNQLDTAYILDGTYTVVADNRRSTPRPANRLLLDADRTQRALAGKASVGWGYNVEENRFLSGYFPLQLRDQPHVLVLDAGEAFTAPQRELRSTLLGLGALGAGLFVLVIFLLGVIGRLSRQEREAFALAETARATAGLAAIVAHEIRNPLGVLRGSAELLAERAGPMEQELARDIIEEADRMNLITEDFLQLSNERPLVIETTPLQPLLAACQQALSRRYPGVVVTVETPHIVEGDVGRLRQIFLNLFNNAAEAQSGKGAIRVTSAVKRGRIHVTVEDEGPGLKTPLPEMGARQGSSTKPGGHGLGLLVVQRLVALHGGAVRSLDVNRGATFELDLAAAPSQELPS